MTPCRADIRTSRHSFLKVLLSSGLASVSLSAGTMVQSGEAEFFRPTEPEQTQNGETGRTGEPALMT